jgi:hypothetical protein
MGDARHSHPEVFVLIYSHSMNRKAVEALSGASDGRPRGTSGLPGFQHFFGVPKIRPVASQPVVSSHVVTVFYPLRPPNIDRRFGPAI